MKEESDEARKVRLLILVALSKGARRSQPLVATIRQPSHNFMPRNSH